MEDLAQICGVLWLTVAVLTGWIASRKGLNGVLYFIFGIMAGGMLFMVFGTIGGVVGGFFAFLFTLFQPSVA